MFDEWVSKNARLSGRSLQPWRALLAVATWLDKNGVQGLWARMESLSWDYQKERLELEVSDFTSLVIRALLHCAITAINANTSITSDRAQFTIETSKVTDAAVKMAQIEELDIDSDTITSRRVGRVLGKMRLNRIRQSGKGPRQWTITRRELEGLALSYGISVPDMLSVDTITKENTAHDNGDYGGNGTNGIKRSSDDLLEGTL
jgi:hypothetical protein